MQTPAEANESVYEERRGGDWLSNIKEQLKRERDRAILIAGFELLLGIIMAYIGWQFFNANEAFRIMIYEMEQSIYTPAYSIDLFRTIQAGTLAGGFFALVHGVKRIADNVLNAWVKSAIPEIPSE